MAPIDRAVEPLVTLAVGLLVGGTGLYLAAWLVVGTQDLRTALVAAVAGAVAWAGVTAAVGGLGGLVAAAVAYLLVVAYLYDATLTDAAAMAAVAWIGALGVRWLLSPYVGGIEAVGVPLA